MGIDHGTTVVNSNDIDWPVPDHPQQTRIRMTPLDRIIRERIALDGPMRVSDFMQICLLHPEHGYYVKNPAFGVQGISSLPPKFRRCLESFWASVLRRLGWIKVRLPIFICWN